MKLTDEWFDAKFYGRISDDGSFSYLESIEGAQGLFLWCPCGFNNPRYREPNGGRPHGVLVPFANPRNAPPVPPNHGPMNKEATHRPRWTMSGTGLNNLTVVPSIAVDSPNCWHGFITNGEVITC